MWFPRISYFLRISYDKCKLKFRIHWTSMYPKLKQQKKVKQKPVWYLRLVETMWFSLSANHLVRIRKGILNLESSLNRNTFSIRKKIENAKSVKKKNRNQEMTEKPLLLMPLLHLVHCRPRSEYFFFRNSSFSQSHPASRTCL